MENIKNTYEVLYALSVKNGEEAVEANKEKIRSLIAENAEIVAEDVWGKRKFAYPINYQNEGYYVLTYFKSEPAFVAELTRVLGITEDALRYMILSVDEKKQTINVSSGKATEEAAVEEASEEIVVEAPAAEEAPAEEAPAAE